MTRLQQLLISAKRLAAWPHEPAARRAVHADVCAYSEKCDAAVLPQGLVIGANAVMNLMLAIAHAESLESRTQLAKALSIAVDGVRTEALHLERLAHPRPEPRRFWLEGSNA